MNYYILLLGLIAELLSFSEGFATDKTPDERDCNISPSLAIIPYERLSSTVYLRTLRASPELKVNLALVDFKGEDLVLGCGHLNPNEMDVRSADFLSKPLETHHHFNQYTVDIADNKADLQADLWSINTQNYLRTYGTGKFQRIMHEFSDWGQICNLNLHKLAFRLLKTGGLYAINLPQPSEMPCMPLELQPSFIEEEHILKFEQTIPNVTFEEEQALSARNILLYTTIEGMFKTNISSEIRTSSIVMKIEDVIGTNSHKLYENYFKFYEAYFLSIGYSSIEFYCLNFPIWNLVTTFKHKNDGDQHQVDIECLTSCNFRPAPKRESWQPLKDLLQGINIRSTDRSPIPYLIAYK